MYDALCVNSDKETHRIQNKERMETFQVTTGDTRSLRGALATRSETAPLARGAEEERSVMEPEALWSDHAERLDIGPASGVKRIVLTPKPRVNTCTVEVRNVENLRHVSALSASVTGMAGGWLAGIDELTTEEEDNPLGGNAPEGEKQVAGRLGSVSFKQLTPPAGGPGGSVGGARDNRKKKEEHRRRCVRDEQQL